MFAYKLNVTKTADNQVCYESPQFKNIRGIGSDYDNAFIDLMQQVEDTLNTMIAKREYFPESASVENNDQKNGTGRFVLPLLHQFKMRLHEAMLAKGITKDDLARLLALSDKEVLSDSWELENIIKLIPKNKPKHQDVDRLLDLRFNSSINDMAEAFRLIGQKIDIVTTE